MYKRENTYGFSQTFEEVSRQDHEPIKRNSDVASYERTNEYSAVFNELHSL